MADIAQWANQTLTSMDTPGDGAITLTVDTASRIRLKNATTDTSRPIVDIRSLAAAVRRLADHLGPNIWFFYPGLPFDGIVGRQASFARLLSAHGYGTCDLVARHWVDWCRARGVRAGLTGLATHTFSHVRLYGYETEPIHLDLSLQTLWVDKDFKPLPLGKIRENNLDVLTAAVEASRALGLEPKNEGWQWKNGGLLTGEIRFENEVGADEHYTIVGGSNLTIELQPGDQLSFTDSMIADDVVAPTPFRDQTYGYRIGLFRHAVAAFHVSRQRVVETVFPVLRAAGRATSAMEVSTGIDRARIGTGWTSLDIILAGRDRFGIRGDAQILLVLQVPLNLLTRPSAGAFDLNLRNVAIGEGLRIQRTVAPGLVSS